MVPDKAEAVRVETLQELVERRELDESDVEALTARIFDGRSTLVLGSGRVLVTPLFERLSLQRREAVVAILMGAIVAPAMHV